MLMACTNILSQSSFFFLQKQMTLVAMMPSCMEVYFSSGSRFLPSLSNLDSDSFDGLCIVISSGAHYQLMV